jgi:preprotein translocase subunit SecF
VIDFVGKRAFFYLLSIAIMIPGIISLILPGGLNAGIEFSSGSTFTARFQQPINEDDLRQAMTELGHEGSRVQKAGDRYLIRTDLIEGAAQTPPIGAAPPSEREELEAALEQRFGPLVDVDGNVNHRFLEFSSVSPSVSSDIGRKAALAVVVAAIAIMIYITLTFFSVPSPIRYGASAIVALLHDVVVVMGSMSILGRALGYEVDTLFITAMLTIVGFSVHDTIVVFDRVRENVKRAEAAGLRVSMRQAVNASMNQTLGRSLNTSITVVLTLIALILLGGDTVREFLVIMLIGLVSGTYSSIFVASMLLVSWDEGDLPRIFGRGRGTQSVEATGVA